jgi:hypothetical protein
MALVSIGSIKFVRAEQITIIHQTMYASVYNAQLSIVGGGGRGNQIEGKFCDENEGSIKCKQWLQRQKYMIIHD